MQATISLQCTAALAAFALVLVVVASNELVVPGCDCDAMMCNRYDDEHISGIDDNSSQPALCNYALIDGNVNYLEGAEDSNTTICDVYDSSTEFQQEYGPNKTLYWNSGGGVSMGPYYGSPGIIFSQGGPGTCDDAIKYHSFCGNIDDSNNNDTSIGNNNDVGYSRTDIVSCTTLKSVDLPELSILTTCESYYNKKIKTGYEDSFDIYINKDVECEEDWVLNNQPTLTSKDWLEPKDGRRYMCTEVTVESETYYYMIWSLGNAPCSGPKPSEQTSSSSSIIAATKAMITSSLLMTITMGML